MRKLASSHESQAKADKHRNINDVSCPNGRNCLGAPVRFSLPFPPSVNNLFSQTKAGRRYPSKRYRTWRKAAEWSLTAARVGRIEGPVSLVIELAPHDRRARDADNFIKGILDLLVANLVLEGDSQSYVREVTSRWLEPSRPAAAHVTIYAAEKVKPPLPMSSEGL